MNAFEMQEDRYYYQIIELSGFSESCDNLLLHSDVETLLNENSSFSEIEDDISDSFSETSLFEQSIQDELSSNKAFKISWSKCYILVLKIVISIFFISKGYQYGLY